MNRIEELTFKLIDDETSDRELNELASRIAVSELDRNTVARIIQIESHLFSEGRQTQAEQVLQKIESWRTDRIENRVLEGLAHGQRGLSDNTQSSTFAQTSNRDMSERQQRTRSEPKDPHKENWPSGLKPAVLVLATCVLFAFALLVLTRQSRDTRSAPVARLNSDSAPRELSNDQTVRTSGLLDSAEITYEDGSVITLHDNTTLTLSSYDEYGKEIVVQSGLIQADFAKQPKGYPVRIVTPTATMDVLGTTLGVEVRSDTTQLEVSSGRVSMTRNSDGQNVEVGAGKFARVIRSDEGQIDAITLPELPVTFSLDFQTGLPTGWQNGTLIDSAGQFVVKTEKIRSKDTPFAIATHNAWQQGEHGLFSLQPNSVLHIRFQQKQYSRIRAMVAMRVFPFELGRFGANCFYTRKAWNEDTVPGESSTISIPLREVDWYSQQRKRKTG